MMSMAFVFLFVVEYSAAKYILVEIADKVDDGLGTIAGLERSFEGISYPFLDEGIFYLVVKIYSSMIINTNRSQIYLTSRRLCMAFNEL